MKAKLTINIDISADQNEAGIAAALEGVAQRWRASGYLAAVREYGNEVVRAVHDGSGKVIGDFVVKPMKRNRRLERLKREAREAALLRGHTPGKFQSGSDKTKARAECKKCGKDMAVNSNPAPNDIDISGEAVAVNCPG